MGKHVDLTGMFQDFNFKLVVIDALLDLDPKFRQELEQLKEIYTEKYEWYADDSGPIDELLQYFSALELEKEDLDKVTELCLDGGNEIYHLIQPDWDGEDDFFDITHVGGFEHLINLKSITYISMCDIEILNPMKEKGIAIFI